MLDHARLNTQKSLSRACGLNARLIGRILRGEQSPSLDMVDRICDAFGTSAADALSLRRASGCGANGQHSRHTCPSSGYAHRDGTGSVSAP